MMVKERVVVHARMHAVVRPVVEARVVEMMVMVEMAVVEAAETMKARAETAGIVVDDDARPETRAIPDRAA